MRAPRAAWRTVAIPVGAAGVLTMVGRAVGLAWTVALVARLGLGDYGRYAMAFSISSLVAGMTDSPFTARSIRVGHAEFVVDQRVRAVLGTAALALGVALLAIHLEVAGFAAVFAGGEACVGVHKARPHRDGDVVREQGIDLGRQLAAVALGFAVLTRGRAAGLDAVVGAYALPYVVASVLALLRHHRSPLRLPPSTELAALGGAAVIGAGYAQLDVVLLGVVVSPAVAGTYALASLVAWAVAMPAQQLITARAPGLRVSVAGAMDGVWTLALALGLVCTGMATALAVLVPHQRATAMVLALMAPFVVTRAVNWGLGTVTLFRRSDGRRLSATACSLAIDVGVLLVLARPLGAAGAALAAVAADLCLLVLYCRIAAVRPPWPGRVAGLSRSVG